MTATVTYRTSTQSPWRADQPSRQLPIAPRSVFVIGESVEAISMPAAFGALVRAELDVMMLAGPVVDGDDGLWIFLTEPAARRSHLPTDLLALGVRPVPAGTPVAVPAATDRPDRPPAIRSTVVGAARRVAHRTSRVA